MKLKAVEIFKKNMLVLFVFILAQLFTVNVTYSKINKHDVDVPRITNSIDQWVEKLGPSDAGVYLRVAKNIEAGKGVTILCTECTPPADNPFFYWGPGAPLYLASGLWAFGNEDVSSLFYLFIVTNFLTGVVLLSIGYMLVKTTYGRVLAAVLVSFVPPIHEHIYSYLLASSEAACMLPFAIFYFAFFKISLQKEEKWNHIVYFFICGLFLGIISIIRESNVMFGYFLISLLILKYFLRNRNEWRKSFFKIFSFYLGLQLIITPVKIWNQQRINASIISSSSSGAIWRFGLWSKHDAADWYVSSGIGFGEYLSPESAKLVEKAYSEGTGTPILSIKELAKAIIKRPIDALIFKINRVPVLWLGTREMPYSEVTFMSMWCLFFIISFVLFVAISWLRKQKVLMPFYAYGLFLFLASFVIHSEFRYSQPVWYSLIFVPIMLFEKLKEYFTLSSKLKGDE